MRRERVLKVVLVLVGSLFCAAIYPLMLMAKQDPALAMMMSLYVTLGVFLLLASRNPSAHRSLIAFAAWSSFAHGCVMAVQASLSWIARRELLGVATFIVIGVALIALAPAKQPVERSSMAVEAESLTPQCEASVANWRNRWFEIGIAKTWPCAP